MSGYVPTVDALADELLAAIRDHPGISLDPALGPETKRLCAAYNRLYCELHDKPRPEIQTPDTSVPMPGNTDAGLAAAGSEEA